MKFLLYAEALEFNMHLLNPYAFATGSKDSISLLNALLAQYSLYWLSNSL
jgi:hypothetical protein